MCHSLYLVYQRVPPERPTHFFSIFIKGYRIWCQQIHGHSDGSTSIGSLGSHGPGSSDDNQKSRRRLDSSSSLADEHWRSAVLLFLCGQYHRRITKWINTLWEESNMPADNRPATIHCKAGSTSVRLIFESRAKCQDFVRYQVDGTSCEIDSLFSGLKQLLLSANPNPLRRTGWKTNCAFVESCLTSSKFSSLIEMTKVHSSSKCSTLVHMSSASNMEETALENLYSNWLLLETDKHLPFLPLSCLSLVFILMCCNVFSLSSQQGQCVMVAPRLTAFSPPGGSRRLLQRFPVSMGSTLCVIFDSQCRFA